MNGTRRMLLAQAWPLPDEGQAAVDARLLGGCSDECHTATLKRRVIKGGVRVISMQCDTCGRSIGGPLKREHHPDQAQYPEWIEGASDRYWQAKHEEGRKAMEDRRGEIAAHASERRQQKDAFYSSGRWAWMREFVMKRSGGTCEACGARQAQAVHHTTYRHGLDAPLFTLRALCHPCHGRMHTLGDQWHDAALPYHYATDAE